MQKGLVHVYTGDGKGKTTAAFGLAIRAAGRGYSVTVVRFLKGGTSGETLFLQEHCPAMTIVHCNSQNKPVWIMDDDELTVLKQDTAGGLESVQGIIKGSGCDLLVLDEIAGAVNRGLVDVTSVSTLLAEKSEAIEVVLTGRDMPQELIDRADLVTEMKKIKHPFDNGIKARPGIEL